MDIFKDNSHRIWYQIGQELGKDIPSYVLDHEVNVKRAASLSDREYADDLLRKYPIDNPADTWLSAGYIVKMAQAGYISEPKYSNLMTRVKEAAQIYGVLEDVNTLVERLTAVEETKEAGDDDYGWVDGDDKKYPMFDARGVAKAAEYFETNKYHYPTDMRRTIARSIMRKAAEYEVELKQDLRKDAGMGMPRRDTLMAELLGRARMYKDAETSTAIAKLNEYVASVGAEELDAELDKLASLVEEADRSEGLYREYGKTILAPSDFIYDIDASEAIKLADDAVELNKYTFSLSKLAELSPDIYANALGDDFAERVQSDGKVDMSKLADELYSMPRPDKAALELYLEEVL